MPDGRIVYVVVGFVVGAAVAGAGFSLVDSSAPGPPRAVEAPSEDVASPPPFEARKVSGINPPSSYVEETRDDVADVLARLARVQQRAYERTGTYTDMSRLTVMAAPSRVNLLSMQMEPTAFCIEAAHAEIPGTRLRFISVTGEIDSGRCDGRRPLAKQVGDDVAAQSGGQMEYTDVRLVERPPPPSSPELGPRYLLLFDAAWNGPGVPEDQECSYRLLDAAGAVIYDGQWGFSTLDSPLLDYKAMTFFGEAQLEGHVPVDVDLECRNRW